jgi:hypothetical protein
MSLGLRKLVVLGLVVSVFLLANALLVAHWLDSMGVIGWAASIRRDFLTGTAITIIIALLILLVPARHAVKEGIGWLRRCPVCDGGISRQAKYCGECGSRV